MPRRKDPLEEICFDVKIRDPLIPPKPMGRPRGVREKKPRKPHYIEFGENIIEKAVQIVSEKEDKTALTDHRVRTKALEEKHRKKLEKSRTEAEAWQELMPVTRRLIQLDRMGMMYLRGNKQKWTRDQALVFKSMFETYSNKLIPPAQKKNDGGGKVIDINVGIMDDEEIENFDREELKNNNES